MKKIFFTLCMLVCCALANGQITRVQHFNIHSTQAAALFAFFNKTFGLPVVYDYQSYGSYSSGGLWLGNITFEFVGATAPPAVFKGIALEPKQHIAAFLPLLDKRHITHDATDVTMWDFNGKQEKFYTLLGLPDISSAGRTVFVCDYEQRDFINSFSVKADSALLATGGGSLGIVGLKSIILNVDNVTKQAGLWAAIPGVKQVNNHSFGFEGGPLIVLRQAPVDDVAEIVIKVKSKAKAAAFLSTQNCIKNENDTLLIDPAKTDGLRILIEE